MKDYGRRELETAAFESEAVPRAIMTCPAILSMVILGA